MKVQSTRAVILVCLTLTLIICSSVIAEERWLSLGQPTTDENPKISVIHSNDSETIIDVEIGGFSVNEVYENDMKFHTLRLPEYHTNFDVGKPELPLISKVIGIPASANVEVEILDSVVEVLEDFIVYPFQTPLRASQTETEFEIDEDFYSRDEFYPAKAAWTDDPAIWRDVRVVTLRVCPFRFNPVSGELRVHTKLTVRLKYDGTSDKNVLEPRDRTICPEYDRMYRNTILNYDYLNVPIGGSPKLDYNLLIITADVYYDDLLPFVAWKISTGTSTEMVRLSDIASKYGKSVTSVVLRNYIADEYATSNIRFVLLVGDIDDLPTHTFRANDLVGEHVGDYYYTLLTGSDYWPEVAVGRFSITSDVHLTRMVDKTMAYTTSTAPWIENALITVQWDIHPDNYPYAIEGVMNALYADPPNFDLCHGREGCDNGDVIDRINEGRGIVYYFGHGSEDCWHQWTRGMILESFCHSDVGSLHNPGMTPIVLGMACHTAKLDYPVACLGETFTRSYDDGAVAYYGATESSMSYVNGTCARAFFSEIFNNSNRYLGEALNAGSIQMGIIHGEGYGWSNARMYLLLGDPSLKYTGSMVPRFSEILYDTSGVAEPFKPEMDSWLLEWLRRFAEGMPDSMALKPYPFDPEDPGPYIPWTRDTALITQATAWFGNYGPTHLADAICYTVDYLDSSVVDTADKEIVLITCGHEDTSSIGQCAGPMDPVYDPDTSWCDDQSSWTCMVWNKVTGSDIVLQVAYFGDGTDKEFLRDLALVSGGGFYDPSDTAICGNGVLEWGENCEEDAHCAIYGEDTLYYGYCLDCKCLCSCNPGDADDDAVHNLLDVTYIINYLYKNGDEPTPYPTCSADPNCDCTVNLLDVTFMINYLYKEGPVPCNCETWLNDCVLEE